MGAALVAAGLLSGLVACRSGGSGQVVDPMATIPTTLPPAIPGSGYGPPVLAGELADPAINESSGLIASRRNPGLYWTHNDSGDEPYIYCVREDGAACGVWRVTGASARDWEDMAAGPGPVAGTSYLYAGDIGDNLVSEPSVTVYRFPEPLVDPNVAPPARAHPAATEAADAIKLSYPDGPHNAEALLVHPQTGDLYIIAKEAKPGVYVARAPLRAGRTTTMEKLGTLPIGMSGRSQATGGDISPDGSRVAISTYGDGFELRLPVGSSFDTIWQQPPQRFALGLRAQGEAIAYRLDGNALFTTTERPLGAGGPIHRIDRQ